MSEVPGYEGYKNMDQFLLLWQRFYNCELKIEVNLKGRNLTHTFDITMENLINMAVMEASQKLSHVTLFPPHAHNKYLS